MSVTRTEFVQCNFGQKSGKLIYSIQNSLLRPSLQSLRLSKPRFLSMAQTIELAQVFPTPLHSEYYTQWSADRQTRLPQVAREEIPRSLAIRTFVRG